ncbi:MAG: cytidine deaminase [Acidimicrobiales bacterium]
MKVDQSLVDAATDQLKARWPTSPGAVAAAMYLDDGSTLTGVALDNINAAMILCAETGVICRAYTLGRKVTASACVGRREDGRPRVLAPCGACQERPAIWGPDVEVAIGEGDDRWASRRLIEVNPFYWATAFTDGSRWPTAVEHAG